MNSIIIDDEPLARKGIELLIAQVPYLTCSGSFSNPIQAHEFLQNTGDVDLIFLDIEMPGLSGLDYLQSMPPAAHVILTTAYPQYALEAFELEVIDYLLKPVKLQRFLKAVERSAELRKMVANEVDWHPNEEFIYIKSERKFIKLFLKDIRFIKGLKDYVIIHSVNQKYMTAMNVGTIYRQLPGDIFARVSKSYIINVNFLRSIDADTVYLENIEIPLGQSYKDDFLQKHVRGKLLKR